MAAPSRAEVAGLVDWNIDAIKTTLAEMGQVTEAPSGPRGRFDELADLATQADAILTAMAMDRQGAPTVGGVERHIERAARWEDRVEEALRKAGADEMQVAFFNRDTDTTLYA